MLGIPGHLHSESGKCFYFRVADWLPDGSQLKYMSWLEARDTCETEMGMEMAAVMSKGQSDFIKSKQPCL